MAEMNPFADQTKLKAQQLTTDGRLPVLTLLQLSQETDQTALPRQKLDMKEYGGGSCAKCTKKLRLKKRRKKGSKARSPNPPTKFSSSGCLSKMGERRFRTLVRYQ